MTDSQLAAWQRHVLYARRRVEQFQVAGNPTGVPEDAAILAADAIVQAAREYAQAVVKAWTSDNQDNIWSQEWRDAQVNMDEKQSALLTAVGGADAT